MRISSPRTPSFDEAFNNLKRLGDYSETKKRGAHIREAFVSSFGGSLIIPKNTLTGKLISCVDWISHQLNRLFKVIHLAYNLTEGTQRLLNAIKSSGAALALQSVDKKQMLESICKKLPAGSESPFDEIEEQVETIRKQLLPETTGAGPPPPPKRVTAPSSVSGEQVSEEVKNASLLLITQAVIETAMPVLKNLLEGYIAFQKAYKEYQQRLPSKGASEEGSLQEKKVELLIEHCGMPEAQWIATGTKTLQPILENLNTQGLGNLLKMPMLTALIPCIKDPADSLANMLLKLLEPKQFFESLRPQIEAKPSSKQPASAQEQVAAPPSTGEFDYGKGLLTLAEPLLDILIPKTFASGLNRSLAGKAVNSALDDIKKTVDTALATPPTAEAERALKEQVVSFAKRSFSGDLVGGDLSETERATFKAALTRRWLGEVKVLKEELSPVEKLLLNAAPTTAAIDAAAEAISTLCSHKAIFCKFTFEFLAALSKNPKMNIALDQLGLNK